jgi:hypothetical protein
MEIIIYFYGTFKEYVAHFYELVERIKDGQYGCPICGAALVNNGIRKHGIPTECKDFLGADEMSVKDEIYVHQLICKECKKKKDGRQYTFTLLPDLFMPHKRYPSAMILATIEAADKSGDTNIDLGPDLGPDCCTIARWIKQLRENVSNAIGGIVSAVKSLEIEFPIPANPSTDPLQSLRETLEKSLQLVKEEVKRMEGVLSDFTGATGTKKWYQSRMENLNCILECISVRTNLFAQANYWLYRSSKKLLL